MKHQPAYNYVDEMFESFYVGNDGFFENLPEDIVCKVDTVYTSGLKTFVGEYGSPVTKVPFDGFWVLKAFPIKRIIYSGYDILYFDCNYKLLYSYNRWAMKGE